MTAATATIPLSVDEATERYPGEWIFMHVTAEDEFHAPSHGIVLAHHPKRARLQRSILKEIAARADPSAQFYIFQAHPRHLTLRQCVESPDERLLERLERAILREGLD